MTKSAEIGCLTVSVGSGGHVVKGKLFLLLFALPFFGIGVWMLYSVGSDFADAWKMQDWQPVNATLSNAGYSSHAGDDSTTYEAFASYTYEFGGRTYGGTRVVLSSGADNIGSYQTRVGNSLRRSWSEGRTIVVYVNPNMPSESIIDRDVRWAMVGFRSIFVFAFGGFGLGLLIYAFRAPRVKDLTDPTYLDRPWLANDDWQSATIRSTSKATMYVTWGFATFWNLISAPLPFAIYAEVLDKQNYLALIGLLFPVIGVGLIVWAIRRTREWNRFGPTPVTLDPFPGSIGGHVGGTIDIRLPYDSAARFKFTLTNLRSYMSGSGKSRSRKEKAIWQDAQYAHTEPGVSGSRVTFRFDVPTGTTESDASRRNDSYHLWRLNVNADLPGADLDRDFEIPVYATATESSELPERAVESARTEQDRVDEQAVKERMNLGYGTNGKELRYPVGRNAGASLVGFLIGAVFAGIGWFLIFSEGERVFGGIFAVVGTLIAAFSLYSVLNSLQVKKESGYLQTVRRILGFPVARHQIRADQVVRFSKDSTMQTQSGRSHVMHYSIYAHDGSGKKVCIGEGFNGAGEAEAAIRIIGREFSIAPRDGFDEQVDAEDELDALAADR